MPRDPFEMEAGGNAADYIGTVTKVVFADGDYNFQATFTNKYDEPRPKDDGTLSVERPEFVTIGGKGQWVPIDGGTGFIAASGDVDARIRDNSGFGRLLGRVFELVGKENLKAEGRTHPYTEAFWLGLRFHWETEGAGESYTLKDKDTGEKKSGKTKGYAIPTEYLGSAGAAASNGHVAEPFDVASLNLPDVALSELRLLAQEPVMTFPEWQGAALKVVTAIEDPIVKRDATIAMSGPGLYEALRG